MKDNDLLLLAGVGVAARFLYPKIKDGFDWLKEKEETVNGYIESAEKTSKYVQETVSNAALSIGQKQHDILSFIPDTIAGIITDLTPKTWDNSIPKQGEGGPLYAMGRGPSPTIGNLP